MQDKFSADPFDDQRPLWLVRLYAITLSVAIIGLFACLIWFGYVAVTI